MLRRAIETGIRRRELSTRIIAMPCEARVWPLHDVISVGREIYWSIVDRLSANPKSSASIRDYPNHQIIRRCLVEKMPCVPLGHRTEVHPRPGTADALLN